MVWILDYPKDSLRYKYFVRESNQHQAKLELRTFMELVNIYTEVGDTILDPMSGIGTIHLANYLGRHTVAIELVPEFVELQRANIAYMRSVWEDDIELFMELGSFKDFALDASEIGDNHIYGGDCRRHLPFPETDNTGMVDAVIFSPPYGSLWSFSAKQRESKVMQEKNYTVGYDDSVANVGNIQNYPHYLTSMSIIYGKCFESLKPGGVLVTVCKDYLHQGRRVPCSRDNLRLCMDAGFFVEDWHFRNAGTQNNPFSKGSREKRIASGKHKPELDIEYEDILVLRKPKE
jgi:modification methylase